MLMSALEEVCDSLPEQIKQPCRSEVDKNLRLVLNFLTALMVSQSERISEFLRRAWQHNRSCLERFSTDLLNIISPIWSVLVSQVVAPHIQAV